MHAHSIISTAHQEAPHAHGTAAATFQPPGEEALALAPPLTGLDAARAFLQRLSWPIYHAVHGSKKPHWKRYKSLATTEATQLTRWWQQCPHANPMTLIQPPYAILDIDPRNGGRDSLDTLESHHTRLPPTWSVWTRDHGYHLYFHLPPSVTLPPPCTHLAPGVELLGPTHPLTIPGFQHHDGQINTWDEFCNPDTMPCSPIPLWLLHLVNSHPTHTPTPHGPSSHGESLTQDHTPFFSSAQTPEATQTPDPTPMTPPRSHGLQPDQATGGGQDSLLHAPRALQALTAGQLVDLLRDPAMVPTYLAYLAGLLGRQPPVLGESFLAWFREEQHASAVFMPPTAEHPNVLYYDFGAVDEHGIVEKAQTLPAVLYHIINGAWPSTMPKPSFLMWGARLVVESGAVQAADAYFPPLPADAPPEVLRAYAGAQSLARARSILARAPGEDPTDMPYAESFCAHWVGISQRAAHEALMWIISRGFFLFRRFRKQLAFFVQGTTRLMARLRHAPIATSQHDAIHMNEQAQHALARVIPAMAAEDITVLYGDALADVPPVPTIAPILMENPQACSQCGHDDYWLKGACQYCIALTANARIAERKRLYGTPDSMALDPVRAG